MKILDLIIAIAWTLVGIVDTMMVINGQDPNWVHVFCPLIIVILGSWAKWLASQKK